ncbi:hypothetical protein ACFFGV_14390 [Pontibacillus salicampi]|uniref:Uncharacterized protein n=1 Tax=Pontibacillus salicampi TaxID=1449801 RepID=A0ABV6LR97_9BACI
MRLMPIFWLIVTLIALVLNLFGLMRLIPMFFTMPLLFVSLYFTIFTLTHRRSFKGIR